MPRATKPRQSYDRETLDVMRLRDAFMVDDSGLNTKCCIDAANNLIQKMIILENERQSKNVRTKTT